MRDDRMIPGFAVDGFEAAQFFVLLGIGGEKSDVAHFPDDEEAGGRSQQQQLPMAEAALLPEPPAAGGIKAREDPVVEAKDVLTIYDEVIEPRLERGRFPFLCDVPIVSATFHAQPRDATPPGDEQLAVRNRMRLKHWLCRSAIGQVLPKLFARFNRHRMQTQVVDYQNLPQAAERDKLWRAVARLSRGSAPDRLAAIRA